MNHIRGGFELGKKFTPLARELLNPLTGVALGRPEIVATSLLAHLIVDEVKDTLVKSIKGWCTDMMGKPREPFPSKA